MPTANLPAAIAVSLSALIAGCSRSVADEPNSAPASESTFRQDADFVVATAFDSYAGPQKFTKLAKRRRQQWETGMQAGDPVAQYLMATVYVLAPDSRHNLPQAMRLLEKSAASGLPHAQVMLGEMLERDAPEVAVALYKKAVEQNFGWGQYQLGCVFRKGELVQRDEELGFKLILLSAHNGITAGQTAVGAI